MTKQPPSFSSLTDAFLSRLVDELDQESVRAIILRGSYARETAIPPYSDVDLTLILDEGAQGHQAKRYIWRDGYAISISLWSLSAYRERLQQPEEAIFVVPGIREARILLEKDDAFRSFQREVLAFQWEPLQAATNRYAGQLLMDQTEIVLKLLRALRFHEQTLLAEVLMVDLVPAVTEAFVVQRGILIHNGNTYFQQAQEVAGWQSTWTHAHRQAIGSEQ